MKQKLAKMACIFTFLFIQVFAANHYGKDDSNYPFRDSEESFVNPIASYEGFAEDDIENTMVPIPMEDRVFNKTGIQCVWCSLETLGRFANEPKLIGLTNLPDCKSYSSPSSAARKLNQIKVRFEQTTSKSDRSLIIKSIVQEKRGCLFAIPGHAMTLVHYDEQAGIVKYINNSDKSLKIRTWSMQEFNRRWDGWICVVYADRDIVPEKYTKEIPIIDKNNTQGIYDKNYILKPRKAI